MNHTEFSMDVASLDIDVEIGDIVGGRDYITGMYAAKPVETKIYHVENGIESIEYELEGEDAVMELVTGRKGVAHITSRRDRI